MKFLSSTCILFLVVARISSACIIPEIIWNSIDSFFAVQVQNVSYPNIDLRHITFTPSGGGDQHLYLSPYGTAVSSFQLQGGTWVNGSVIHAVVSRQVGTDGTKNIFFTERTQQLASLNARFGCHPVTDSLQVEFYLQDGARTCVKPASGGRYELRYKPIGVSAPTRIDVTLASDPPFP